MWTINDAMTRGSLIVIDDGSLNNADTLNLVNGKRPIIEPMVYKYHMGRTPKDLIGTGWVGRYLLADSIVNMFRSYGFTGWSTYDVLVFGKSGERIEGYQGLAVKGRCGPPEDSRSQIIGKPSCGFIDVRGLYFDEGTWDGSDIFMPDTTAYICITEPVYEAICRLRPTNIRFTRLDEVVASVLIV